MGNSEVGHLNMGAGRVVYQELTRITKAIQDGDFFENEELVKAVENAKQIIPHCTCSDFSLTAVFTATSPTYSDFWSWQNVRVSRKFMYTASWMAVTLLRHPENLM